MTSVTRRTLLFSVLAGGARCSREWNASPDRHTALRKAAGYLWDQQGADGGWQSKQYGLLRSGQSLTGLVLNALLDIPGGISELPRDRMMAATSFLVDHIDDTGAVGQMDPAGPDYPNYATALALKALCRAPMPLRTFTPIALVNCLRRQQFSEENGWTPDDAAYGGWGMGGDVRRPPNPGHVDLSMTRYVLEGLAASGVNAGDPAFERAVVFLRKCQNFIPGAEPRGTTLPTVTAVFSFRRWSAMPIRPAAAALGTGATGHRQPTGPFSACDWTQAGASSRSGGS